jgi:hypothetical protein
MQSNQTQDLTAELAKWEAASDQDWLAFEAELMESGRGLVMRVREKSHVQVRPWYPGMPDSTHSGTQETK